ncbi:MAG: protein kinase [Planctomycetes bacterium]|nr:protein kinase [Planctomycetota bacterium]
MSTSAGEPTRPTVPSSEMPTLKPGELSPNNDGTRATTPARAGMSDTRATVPAHLSSSAPTQVAGPGGLSATAATALHVEGSARPAPSATGSHEGEQWGDFHVGRLLGRGGMGAVYAGRQVSLDRPVAIKVLIGHLAQNEDFRKRFLLEARAAARINSPHVVQVYFAGTHGDMDFFAMEYVEGADLSRKLKDGWRPTPPECLGLIIQATRSLVALGEHNIVHRDIKPANYMLTSAGMVKLMDFGLVRFASEAHGLTQTGTIMGTVNYFSPEQGRGEVCDQRTDLYALGVMFYEMLTGKLPFTGGDATSVIYQHIHTEPKPPKLHNPSVTEPYQSVVLKCLEKDAKDRYQTAKSLLEDLERIHRGEKPLLPGRAPRTATGGVAASSTRKLTLAAVVVIAAVILGLALLLRPAPATVVVAATDPTATVAPAPAQSPTTLQATIAPPPTIPPATVVPPVVAAVAAPALATPPPATAPTPPPQTKPAETPVVIAAATPTPTPTPQPPAAPVATAVVEKPVAIAPATPPVVIEAPARPVAPPVTAPVVVEAPAKPLPAPTVTPVVTKPTPPPPGKPVVVTPAKPAAPTAISTPVQSTVRVAIPAGDALLKSSTWLWWLEGPNGRSGRLSARSTRRPEVEWTAPAQPGSVTLHVAAVGSERHLALLLVATAAPAGADGTLTPFLRANFADERHVQRLTRDLDGSWWLVDVDESIISRNSDGWLSSERFTSTPVPARPVAVATSPTTIAVLNNGPPALVLYGRDGTPGTTIPGFQRPSDVVALADGTWAVADMRSGGVLVIDAKGTRVRTHQRSATGGWDLLTRLATDGKVLYALDSGTPSLVVFGTEPQPLITWPLDRASRPVAIAAHNGRVFVLATSGEIRVLDPKGQVLQTLPSAVGALPDESLGVPSDITIDSTGDIYVAYPGREMIARHSADGKQLSIRHARTWTWRAYAADGANRIYAIDAEHRRVVVLDAEGWRQGTIGKALAKGGTFESPLALAAHPNGTALAVLDEETMQVTRFDLTNGTHLVFGGRGKNDGQFDSPVAVAMDQDGRTYVLDTGMHRVSLFDAQGGFQRNIGRYERGDAPDMLRAPRLITVSNDGASLFVYDEDNSLVKRFAIDHASNQVRHLGNFGGRGTGPGQFTRITGMGCDRRGRLYCLDYKRADLQVFDVTGETPTLLTAVRGDQHGIRRMLNLALTPDGIPLIIGGDQLTGLRWER